MRQPSSTTAALLACLLVPFAATTLAACEVEDDSDAVDAISAGASGTGGEDHGEGDAGGAGDGGAHGVDPTTLPACPTEWCPGGGAHCVDAALVTAEEKALLRGCDEAATSYCVPDEAIEADGDFIAASCASLSGLEGRCLSLCLPDVAAQADSLPQSTCPQTHRCAPCYDPFTGADTGACAISSDPGPAQPPETFPTCCLTGGIDIGHCVPIEALSPDEAARFGQEACGAGDELCVPDAFGIGPFCPQVPAGSPFGTGELCTTSALAQAGGGASAEGVCLPTCMPEVAAAPEKVGQEGCSAEHKCVPCEQNGVPTGACEPMPECDGGS